MEGHLQTSMEVWVDNNNMDETNDKEVTHPCSIIYTCNLKYMMFILKYIFQWLKFKMIESHVFNSYLIGYLVSWLYESPISSKI